MKSCFDRCKHYRFAMTRGYRRCGVVMQRPDLGHTRPGPAGCHTTVRLQLCAQGYLSVRRELIAERDPPQAYSLRMITTSLGEVGLDGAVVSRLEDADGALPTAPR